MRFIQKSEHDFDFYKRHTHNVYSESCSLKSFLIVLDRSVLSQKSNDFKYKDT